MHFFVEAATAVLLVAQTTSAVSNYLFSNANCQSSYVACTNLPPADCCQYREPVFRSAAWFSIPKPDGVAVYAGSQCSSLINYSPNQPGGNICLTAPNNAYLIGAAYFNPQSKRSEPKTCNTSADRAGFAGHEFDLTGMPDEVHMEMMDWFESGNTAMPKSLKAYEVEAEKRGAISTFL